MVCYFYNNILVEKINFIKSLFLILLFFISTISFLSCNNSEKSKFNHAVIEGRIINAPDTKIFLEEITFQKPVSIASTVTDEFGNFKIKLDSVNKTFYRFNIDDNNIIHLFLFPFDTIFIEAEYPIIPKTYTIEGSDDCKLLRKMNLRLIESTEKLNQLKNIYSNSAKKSNIDMDSLRIQLSDISNELYISDKEYLYNFIKENYKSPVIYAALYQYIQTSPILTVENDYEIFSFALKSLQKFQPDIIQTRILASELSKVSFHKNQVATNIENLKISAKAPDFIINSIDNQKIALSEFRDTYVLLYFWASWSNKSRINNNVLKRINNNYSDKMLEIIQISLDSNRNIWKNAIVEDEIDKWLHVSDLEVWNSPLIQAYGIKEIPMAIIIDKSGEILFIDSEIENIEIKLKELFSDKKIS